MEVEAERWQRKERTKPLYKEPEEFQLQLSGMPLLVQQIYVHLPLVSALAQPALRPVKCMNNVKTIFLIRALTI